MIREALVAALAFAQTAPGTFSTSTSVPVSPSVIATQMCTVDAEGNGTLELLVLWRGSPGWFRAENGSGGASGAMGVGGNRRGFGADREVRTAWLTEGGVNLNVRFEPSSRKTWIQEREVDLSDANVVLVDDVDTGAGLRIADLVKIDSSFHAMMEMTDPAAPRAGSRARPSREPRPVHMFIRRSPELIDYLRCDVPLQDAPQEEARIFEMYCSALIQR